MLAASLILYVFMNVCAALSFEIEFIFFKTSAGTGAANSERAREDVHHKCSIFMTQLDESVLRTTDKRGFYCNLHSTKSMWE